VKPRAALAYFMPRFLMPGGSGERGIPGPADSLAASAAIFAADPAGE